jgi:hypothetical protein
MRIRKRWWRRRRRPARHQRPLPMLHCPHCRALLPERVRAYALHTIERGQSVRLSVDLDAAAVHIDVATPHSEPRHAATVEAAGTGEAVLRMWEPLLLSVRMRRCLPGLAAHAWQRALETQGMNPALRLLQEPRPSRPHAEPVPAATEEHQTDRELLEAGQTLEQAGTDRRPGPAPGVDGALAKVYAELDEWIEQYGPDRAPDHLKDPAALCAAIAMVFHIDIKRDPTKMIALAAGAITRLVLPPERHQLPPDPFKEGPQ